MDPVRNPYAPGAGTPPPELAGRAEIIEGGRTALQRVAQGRPSQGLILVGLRGVGKTVLLNRLSDEALLQGFKVASAEAHEGKPLPNLIVPALRSVLYGLSTVESAKEGAKRGLRALRGFLGSVKLTINDVDLGLSVDPEPGLADSGDIEADLPDLIGAVGEAARQAGRPVALLIDELQYLEPAEFSALIMSVHRVNQRRLPFLMIGAGLPQVVALAGNSKSYAERLFRYPEIGALGREEAALALAKPARDEGVEFTHEAVSTVVAVTEGYPYYLQQWAYEAWNIAQGDVIDRAAVEAAGPLAVKELDQSFFKVRFDRCTPSEKRYMRALAEFGPGKHRSGDIADKLGLKVTSVAPIRGALIKKGMIYSPSHGDNAFTVPLFDKYMKRAIPHSP